MLGRKPKNEFVEASLAFEENSTIKTFSIKMPFVYAFTVETNDPNNTKMHTIWEYYIKNEQDMDLVIKEIENDQSFKVKVTKVEPAVRHITDLCPRCHGRGIPKIEKKDAHDRRTRRPTYLGEIEKNKVYSERPKEFWLTYTHSKSKKCRICQYLNTPYPTYKKNGIPIEKYFFPWVISEMKKGLFWYS